MDRNFQEVFPGLRGDREVQGLLPLMDVSSIRYSRDKKSLLIFTRVKRLVPREILSKIEKLLDEQVLKDYNGMLKARICEEYRLSESYRLPDQEAGGSVRNWFLADDDMRKEGFFSIQNTAQELLDHPQTKAVLERYIPALVRFMTEKNVIPLGLALKSILSRDADEALDIKALNKELNRIPDTDE